MTGFEREDGRAVTPGTVAGTVVVIGRKVHSDHGSTAIRNQRLPKVGLVGDEQVVERKVGIRSDIEFQLEALGADKVDFIKGRTEGFVPRVSAVAPEINELDLRLKEGRPIGAVVLGDVPREVRAEIQQWLQNHAPKTPLLFPEVVTDADLFGA